MSQPQSRARASPRPIPRTSKSSFRSPGAGTMSKERTQNQNQNKGLGLLLSPVVDLPVPGRSGSPKTVGFDESAVPALEEGAAGHNEEQERGTVDPETEFQPFFTLISDGVTSEHYHPTVHYVFADDEEGEELVSEGVVRALSGLGAGGLKKENQNQNQNQKEHVLILDVDIKSPNPVSAPGEPTGPNYEVTQAQSLSSEWQVSNVEVTSAPTMSQGEEEEGNGGYMLRIEGRGLLGEDTGAHEMGREGLESLLGGYERGLAEIRRMANLKLGEGV